MKSNKKVEVQAETNNKLKLVNFNLLEVNKILGKLKFCAPNPSLFMDINDLILSIESSHNKFLTVRDKMCKDMGMETKQTDGGVVWDVEKAPNVKDAIDAINKLNNSIVEFDLPIVSKADLATMLSADTNQEETIALRKLFNCNLTIVE